jgi:3-phosphoshikimate 1-carboxyvinyltransferase
MVQSFNHIERVKGELSLPGDKSISHRAVFFSAMAKGNSKVYNLSDSLDVQSTISCFNLLGARIENKDDFVSIDGVGYKGFKKPDKQLNASNSGTTARLLTGLLSAQNFESEITGDESLSLRPMKRIITPLSEMGAKISSVNNKLPLKIYPPEKIFPINYELAIPSAQIKSSMILAGLHCEEKSTITEFLPSRNHTELMLGLDVNKNENSNTIIFSKSDYPVAREYFIPGDISSAAFFVVLALLIKNSILKIKDISLNPTRTGYLNILKDMGAKIEQHPHRIVINEQTGDIIIESSELKNIDIPDEIIPNIIDEIPVLTIAGIFADGAFKITGASELRKKESDRINSICYNLRLLGLNVEESEDGFTVSGDIKNTNVTFESFDDHRIAMAFAVLSLILKDGGKVNNFDCVKISNPEFIEQLKSITV